MKTNQLKRVFVLTSLVLLGSQLFAQNLFEIKVKLIKHENEITNGANATLLDAKTMEIVAENVTNDNGEIIFEAVQQGEYVLMVQKHGYKKAETRFIDIDKKGIVSIVNSKSLAENSEQSQTTQLN